MRVNYGVFFKSAELHRRILFGSQQDSVLFLMPCLICWHAVSGIELTLVLSGTLIVECVCHSVMHIKTGT